MKKISSSLKGFTQNELVSHLLASIFYFLVLGLFRFKLDINLFWLWAGGLVGTYVLDIDHLIYWFWGHPEKEDSKRAREVVVRLRGKKLIEIIKLIRETGMELYQLLKESHQGHNRLTFHTVIFQIVLLILTVYVLSSSGSYFGAGMVLAMNLHLLKDVWQDYFIKGKDGLADWFLWQIKGWGVEKYLKEYLIITSVVFGLMTALFV